MPRSRPAMSIDFDVSEGAAALGVVQGITDTVKTSRYTGSVLEYAHGLMAEDFDQLMDGLVMADPGSYNHVYDWRSAGHPANRLWRHKLKGRGASREATWEWRASKKPIPTPLEYKEMGDKNMSLIPDEELQKLSNRRYIFTWKAPIMEYSLTVSISPKYSSALFIPTGNADRPFVFSRTQIVVTNPGGDQSTGKFTGQFVDFFGGDGAERIFRDKVSKTIENDLGKTSIEAAAKKSRARNKTMGYSTFSDFEYAFESGKEFAEAYVYGQAESYKRANTYIEDNA